MKKTNKTFKRFAAITSASLLAACAIAPVAFNAVAATEFNLAAPTLPADSDIKNVKAYKIFSGEFEDDNTFNVTGWIDGVQAKLVAEYPALKDKTAEQAAVIISGLSGDDLEEFAKAAAIALRDDTAESNGIAGNYDQEDGKVTFTSDLGAGYYLVLCDVQNGTTETYTAKSLGMLTVTGKSTNIGYDGTAKIGLPQVEKKVKENVKSVDGKPINDPNTTEKWNDVADYNINDSVSFKLYGTMPSDIEAYDTYYYMFNDTLGTEFDKPISLTINIDNKETENDLTLNAAYAEGEWTVKNGTTVVDNVSVAYDSDSNGFTVEFTDIKGNQKADTSTLVTIEYDAVLNKSAAIGLPGQINKVDLTYSNNPNNSGAGNNDKGTTPEDKVIVYTYELDVLKTFQKADGSSAGIPDDYTDITFTLAAKGGSNLKFSLIDGVYYPDENGTIEELTLNTEQKILVKGIDDGVYTLTETNGAEGFNKASAKDITISATTVNNQLWNGTPSSGLTKFDEKELAEESKDCIKEVPVINTQGTTLPGTGGIGTTIFYLGGGAMAAIGGVYLISKRRMKKSEE